MACDATHRWATDLCCDWCLRKYRLVIWKLYFGIRIHVRLSLNVIDRLRLCLIRFIVLSTELWCNYKIRNSFEFSLKLIPFRFISPVDIPSDVPEASTKRNWKGQRGTEIHRRIWRRSAHSTTQTALDEYDWFSFVAPAQLTIFCILE